MALSLGTNTVQIAFPVVNLLTLEIDWYYDLMPILFDDASGSFDLYDILYEYASLAAKNPIWTLLTNDAEANQYSLNPGDNSFNTGNIINASIVIDQADPLISLPWWPSDYGTYGFIESTDALGHRHQEYITSKNYSWDASLHPPSTGMIIHLYGDTTGHVTLYPWLGVPPIQYNVNEGTWDTYSLGAPWYGNPTLPFPKPDPG
jgi:hypothetical protein